MAMLKFATFSSDIELPFFTSLASHKINYDKLDDSARRVLGLYDLRPDDGSSASCRMQLHGNALTGEESVCPQSKMNHCSAHACFVRVPTGYYRAEGILKNFNTIENYRSLDKAAVLNRAGRTVKSVIQACAGTKFLSWYTD